MAQTREAGTRPAPLDTVLFKSPVVEIAKFRVRPGHPRFHDSGPIQRHIVVFPRTLVRITHEGEEGFIAGPDLVTYYNRGQIYRREAVNGQPDRCEWFAFGQDVLTAALAQFDPSAPEHPHAPFECAFGHSDSGWYLRQRRVVEALSTDPDTDPVEVEEEMIHILDRLVTAMYRACGKELVPATPSRTAAERRDRALVEEAKTAIGKSFRRRVLLTEIAADLEVSVFHLCRAFRRIAGLTLHEFRNRLRLAAALERIHRRPLDLTEVALDLGYSSHSHFTAAFRRAYGIPPSEFRTRRESRSALSPKSV